MHMAERQIAMLPRHRTAKGARRLQDLTAVAAELFLERGFESVAVDDLIARVGGSRRNVYSHFGGKEGLFIEAVTRLCAELAKPLERITLGDGPAQEVLLSFGSHLLRTVMQPRTLELHRLMVAEGKRFPELGKAVLHAGHFKAAEILTPWIESRQGTHAHEFGDHLPARALALQFVNLVVVESQLRALTGLDSLPLSNRQIDTIVKGAITTFLCGVKIQKASQ